MKKPFKRGLLWGISFYLLSMIIIPLLSEEKLSIFKMLMGIPLWLITGIALGYIMNDRKKRKRR